MKTLFFLLSIIIATNGHGQTAEDYIKLSNKVDSLQSLFKSQIETINNINNSIIENSNKADLIKRIGDLENSIKITNANYSQINTTLHLEYKTRYSRAYKNIIHSLDLIDKIESNYSAIQNNLAIARTFNLIAQANSPESNILGFKFSEVIIKLAKEELELKLPEKERSRFANIIQGIVDNPFVSSVSKSVPVVGSITGIISSISGFFLTKTTSQYRDQRPDRGLISMNIYNEQAFTSEQIKAFLKKINPYLNFYEALNNQSMTFEFNLAKLETKYQDLGPRIKGLKEQLASDLQIKFDANKKENTDKFYQVSKSGDPNFDFLSIINSSNNLNAQSRIYPLLILSNDMYKFHNEYLEIVKDNFKNNIALINEAENLPEKNSQSVNELRLNLTRLKSQAENGFTVEINKMIDIQQNIITN